ncbi:MAG: hypothetical protein IKA72_01145 [Clostridia bacterium]|nr:hypothetical protein [Clostridia bacterium]
MGFLNFSYNQLEWICGVLFCLSLVLTGVLCAMALFKYRKMRIERFKKATREFSFALPDRENTFIRERLRGELQSETEKKPQPNAVLMKDLDVRLDYTRKTVAKLKALQLTPADRLEVNRISKTVTFYALKNALSPSETRSLNDCFARLLKLTAKYAV